MARLVPIVLLLSLLIILNSPSLLCAQQSTDKNRVIVMGMIHRHHKTVEQYSIDRIKQIIRDVNPDFVLTEIPPDRIAEATKQFESTGKITESRVKVFPEYVDALFPLTREMDFKIVPCAGWTTEMNESRRKTMAELKTTHATEYAEMEAAQKQANVEIAKLGPIHIPRIIHRDDYDELVRQGMEPYDRHFNELIGDGGWTNINRAHYALIEKALDKHTGAGKTFLITFGSWHKYYIKDQLRKRDDIELVSLQQYLKPQDSDDMNWPRFRLNASNTGASGGTEIKSPELVWKFDTGGVMNRHLPS